MSREQYDYFREDEPISNSAANTLNDYPIVDAEKIQTGNNMVNQRYGADTYSPLDIEASQKVYSLDYKNPETGEITDSNFYMNEETYKSYLREDGTFDVKRYCDEQQIAPDSNYGTYKNHISCYDVNEPVHASEGYAMENPTYGKGGAHQIVIGDDEKSKLTRNEEYEKSPEGRINPNECYLCCHEDGTPDVAASKEKAYQMNQIGAEDAQGKTLSINKGQEKNEANDNTRETDNDYYGGIGW